MKKIGFCCKYIESYDQCNGLGKNDLAKKYNTSTTTIAKYKCSIIETYGVPQHRIDIEHRLYQIKEK